MQKSLNDLLDFYGKKAEFRSATEYTAGLYGFNTELIEKDYLCTVILKYLFNSSPMPLTFKGGTLIAKVYAEFYRLSEDLDFTISTAKNAKRKERSQLVKVIKNKINEIEKTLTIFKLHTPLSGRNESRQYIAELNYTSNLSSRIGRILIDVGLREETVDNIIIKPAATLMKDPFSQSDVVECINIPCLSLYEAYAEKLRAAISRKKLAIRDFYDLHYAIKHNIIKLDDPVFIEMVKVKMQLPDAKIITFDNEKVDYLKEKIDIELIPTLNQKNNYDFDLNNIIIALRKFIDINKLDG